MTSMGSNPQATGIAAARPAQDGVVPVAEAGMAGGDWAICCSGGGIRSAAYCLGALQSLDLSGLLGAANWIIGVSGAQNPTGEHQPPNPAREPSQALA